jgi:hypothetical protein
VVFGTVSWGIGAAGAVIAAARSKDGSIGKTPETQIREGARGFKRREYATIYASISAV